MPAKDESLKSKPKAKKELDITKLSKVKNRKIARTFRRKEILKDAKIVINWRKLWAFTGIIVVFTLVLYGTSMFGQTTYNDSINIQIKTLAYPVETLGLQLIALAQSKPLGQPWVLASYLWDVLSFPGNVAWYRFVNIVLHAASSVYLFLFMFQALFWMKEERRIKFDPYNAALVIAILFACQPLAVGSVGYISGRAGLLAASNLLLGLNFFMIGFYATEAFPIIAWYFAAIGCFVMGLLCSAQGIAFPFITVGLAVLMKPPKEAWKVWFKERWQDFAIFGGASIAALATLMTQFPALLDNGVDTPLLSRSAWMAEQASAIVTYFLRYLVLPIGITSNNPTPEGMVTPLAVLGIAVLVGLAVSLRWVKQNPLAVFGGVIAIAGLVTNFVVVQHEVASDQRYYIPLVGLAILAGSILVQKVAINKSNVRKGIAIAVAISAFTIWRETIWLSDLDYWTTAAQWEPKNARTLGSLAHAQYMQGKKQAALTAKEALKIDPECAPANEALGLVLVTARKFSDAEIPLRQAVATARKQKTVAEKLSLYDEELADAAMRAEDWKTAREAALEGATMRPGMAQLHLALGRAYLAENDPSHAFEELNIGSQLDKYNPEFLEPTADACLALGSPNYVAFGYTKARQAAKITQSKHAVLTYIKAAMMMGKIPEAKEKLATFMTQRGTTAETLWLMHLAEKFDHNADAASKWANLALIKDPEIASKVIVNQVDLTQMRDDLRRFQREEGVEVPGVKAPPGSNSEPNKNVPAATPKPAQLTPSIDAKTPTATSSPSSARSSSQGSEPAPPAVKVP